MVQTMIKAALYSRFTVVCLLAMVLGTSGCTDPDQPTVTYSNLAQAQEGGMLKRGWLPAIMPPSTVNIRAWHALDSISAYGYFQVAQPAELAVFEQQLRSQPAIAPTKEVKQFVKEHAQARLGYYVQGIDNWVFATQPTGQVAYRAWVNTRPSSRS